MAARLGTHTQSLIVLHPTRATRHLVKRAVTPYLEQILTSAVYIPASIDTTDIHYIYTTFEDRRVLEQNKISQVGLYNMSDAFLSATVQLLTPTRNTRTVKLVYLQHVVCSRGE